MECHITTGLLRATSQHPRVHCTLHPNEKGDIQTCVLSAAQPYGWLAPSQASRTFHTTSLNHADVDDDVVADDVVAFFALTVELPFLQLRTAMRPEEDS